MSSAEEYDEQLWGFHASDGLTMRISEKEEELGRENTALGREDCWSEMEDEKGGRSADSVAIESAEWLVIMFRRSR